MRSKSQWLPKGARRPQVLGFLALLALLLQKYKYYWHLRRFWKAAATRRAQPLTAAVTMRCFCVGTFLCVRVKDREKQSEYRLTKLNYQLMCVCRYLCWTCILSMSLPKRAKERGKVRSLPTTRMMTTNQRLNLCVYACICSQALIIAGEYHLIGMVKYCCDYATSEFTSKFVTSGILLAILSGLI